jgi:NAD(P)-dependent dehydrogenase (short-subunit alcohol dehydrogenase family)
MNVSLAGRRALVTGANSGIGQAIALALGAAGADVVVNYVTHPEAADAVVAQLVATGRRALALRADVSDEAGVDAMFTAMDAQWGGIDVLVNCAGIDGVRALAQDATMADWRRVVEVNLFGAFDCARHALARMLAQRRGVILSISSVHEVVPWSGYSAYTASKAGLAMMTKTLAQEAAPHGVRVLALGPGAIRTPINQSVWADPAASADLLTKIPLGRMGSTDEVAAMAVVLCSDVASYVTGTTVMVDGGMTDYPEFARGG